MVHKRSQYSIVRRHALATAKRDREIAETISTAKPEALHKAIREKWAYVSPHAVDSIKSGDVLNDARGRGTLDRKNPAKSDFVAKVVCTRSGRNIVIPLPGR